MTRFSSSNNSSINAFSSNKFKRENTHSNRSEWIIKMSVSNNEKTTNFGRNNDVLIKIGCIILYVNKIDFTVSSPRNYNHLLLT